MSNNSEEKAMFDYGTAQTALAEGSDDSEDTGAEASDNQSSEPTAEKSAVSADDNAQMFDYGSAIEKMEQDATISDDNAPSGDDDTENDSGKKSVANKTENDSGNSTREPTVDQLFRAAKAGLEQDDIKGLSANELATAIRVAEKLGTGTPKSNADEGETGATDEDEPLFKPISVDGLDEFDEDTVALVNTLSAQFNENMERMAGELKKAQELLGQSQEQAQQQGQLQFFEWFDKRVSDLGDTWHDVFGDDPAQLQQGDLGAQNRIKLIEEMDRLAVVHPEYSQERLFETSMRVLFPSEMKSKEEQKAKDEKRNYRNSRSTMRPTQRNRSIENMPEGREKALAMVKDLGKKKKFFGLF